MNRAPELPYDRGPADMLGKLFRADIAGRTLPCGGRGTDRDSGEAEGLMPPDVALEGCDLMPPTGGRGMLWFIAISVLSGRADPEVALRDASPADDGGRGTNRPPGSGIGLTLDWLPGVRPSDGFSRAIGFAAPRVPGCIAFGFDALTDEPIRLTVGREAAANEGRAAGAPVFGPSLLSRVGETSGLPMLGTFRRAFGETRMEFAATGKPRASVWLETAVKAPGLLA